MNRQWIRAKLANYHPENSAESINLDKLKALVEQTASCFDRDLYEPGHITGSAWIVNRDQSKVLLHHHLKLHKWIQLGGHSDSHPNTLEVALREAQEESGLKSLTALNENIFDIDVHTFPLTPKNPEHLHFDIRFLFVADESEPFNPDSHESQTLRWIPLAQVKEFNSGESISRMVRKTQKLFPKN